jgi:O-antigen/teichoic acid export membrane protein
MVSSATPRIDLWQGRRAQPGTAIAINAEALSFFVPTPGRRGRRTHRIRNPALRPRLASPRRMLHMLRSRRGRSLGTHRRQSGASGSRPPAEQWGARSPAHLNRVFRRGFFETFFLDIAARALSAASLVVLIRGLGASAFAFVTLFLIFAQFLASAAGGGVRLRYLRHEAERISRDQGQPAVSFAMALVTSSVLVAAIALAFLPIVYFFVNVPAAGTPIGLLLYSFGFGIGSAAIELAVAHYQARKRFRLAGAIGVLRAAALLAVSIAVVAADASGPPELPLWFVGGMVALGLLATWPILRRHDPPPVKEPLRDRLLITAEEGWLTVYVLAAAGFAYVDVIVASMFLTSVDIATLGATLRYLAIALAAIPAIGAVLRVRVSQFDVVDSGETQRRLVLAWLRFTALPGVIMLAVLIALTPFVIPLIDGGRYPGSIVAFQIFVPLVVIAYMTEPGPNVLMAQKRYAMLALLFGLALAINFVGDLIVAPHWGVPAIALVSSSCFVAMRIAVTVYSLRIASREIVGA